ncbi:hypothetical protein ACFOKI_14810 [Sphingomonas qilianensis]|uniref:Entericidin EcnAB n=1 Tax=Sphingomonas qilianensis TaxID=1736690 RepID=A0ABU9XMF5_9SPHN
MKKFIAPVLIGAVAAMLAACSPAAQNETAQAGDQIAADANATFGEAINDTDAAADRAFGSAEATMDNSAATLGNAADDAADATGAALKDAGNAIED